MATEPQAEFERRPRSRKAGVDLERTCPGAQAEKSVGEGLPDSAHRRQMQATGSRAGEVVEVEASGNTEQLECSLGAARPGERGLRTLLLLGGN